MSAASITRGARGRFGRRDGAMVPPADAGRWGRGVGAIILAGTGIGVWWPVLGDGFLRAAPIILVAALLGSGRLSPRAGSGLVVVWLPLSVLLAGEPLRALGPRGLADTATQLSDGVSTLAVPARSAVTGDPWPLAAALVVAGLCWCAGALIGSRRGRVWSALGFLLLALPLALGLALEQSTEAAWQGTALLCAGLLWVTSGRVLPALGATATIALIAVVGTQALGPKDRWIAFGGERAPAFSELETEQSYGPITDRRTGKTMLEITSDRPALWRMQVLDAFNGRGFVVSRMRRFNPPIAQPAAKSVMSKVKVVGLRNALAVAPGRITTVIGKGETLASNGEARGLTPPPKAGETYRVESDRVEATTAQLEKVKIPTGSDFDQYLRFRTSAPPTPLPRPAAALADNLPPGYEGTPLARVLTLARKLSKGTDSELEVVRRVQNYLLDPKRFKYSTDVEIGGAQPLVDFLLNTHTGYCQHFAGAAALLLRLGGVPTRVVSGFATGSTSDGRTYTVKDTDAHAWIEVYFPNYGWVPFNPTPAEAQAEIPTSLDLLAPPASNTVSAGDAALPGALLGGAALLLLGYSVRRRRRTTDGATASAQVSELLTRLVTPPVPPATTLSMLRPQLGQIGPAVAALGDAAELERYEPGNAGSRRSPRLRVWRALSSDLGPLRASRLLIKRH